MDSLETNLQKALDLVHIWCLKNDMLLDTDKTKLMLIASRQKRSSLIDSYLYRHCILAVFILSNDI